MNAPESPPTWEEAITPPFLTASLSIARHAVVPWQPQLSRPISSRICATESPTAGVGGQGRGQRYRTERRVSGKPPYQRADPFLVILNAVFLMTSAISLMFASGCLRSAARTTPGPETPTFISQSYSPTPWNAPRHEGVIPLLRCRIQRSLQRRSSCCPW